MAKSKVIWCGVSRYGTKPPVRVVVRDDWSVPAVEMHTEDATGTPSWHPVDDMNRTEFMEKALVGLAEKLPAWED